MQNQWTNLLSLPFGEVSLGPGRKKLQSRRPKWQFHSFFASLKLTVKVQPKLFKIFASKGLKEFSASNCPVQF